MCNVALPSFIVLALAVCGCGDDGGGPGPGNQHAPDLAAFSLTTMEDTPISQMVVVTDADDDVVTLTIDAPTHGTVTEESALLTYTPEADYAGDDTFTVTASDGVLTTTLTVSVTVAAVNDVPAAMDDALGIPGGAAHEIATSAVLANDLDVDGPIPVVTSVSSPVNGTVSLAATTITFTPSAAFTGTASFDYTVSDGTLTDTGTVVLTVTAMCGDGIKNGSEACDDNDLDETDGCTSKCVAGAICTVAALPGGDAFVVDPFTGHCYVAFNDDTTTFAVAQSSCVAGNGYLATITSAGEQALVSSIQNPTQNPWIGAGEDANDTDAVFDWVTDDSFSYMNFATGQPDDDVGTGGFGDCLHLFDSSGTWNDTNCNISSFVVGRICEVEANACGDSVVQGSETCDDGNTSNNDGCNAACEVEI